MDNQKIELLIRHGIDNTLKQMQTISRRKETTSSQLFQEGQL